ncbi:hypothetical protein HGM15179_001469, partial [Zosterops borbonicus]
SRLKGAKLTGNSPCLSGRLCFPPAGGGGLGCRRTRRGREPRSCGDRPGQRPPAGGGGEGGRQPRHRGPAPGTRSLQRPTGAARAPGAPPGRAGRGAPSGEGGTERGGG